MEYYTDTVAGFRDALASTLSEVGRGDVIQLKLVGEHLQHHELVTLSAGDDVWTVFQDLLDWLVQSNMQLLTDGSLQLIVQVVQNPRGASKWKLPKL